VVLNSGLYWNYWPVYMSAHLPNTSFSDCSTKSRISPATAALVLSGLGAVFSGGNGCCTLPPTGCPPSFQEAHLEDAKLRGAQLQNAGLTNAHLERAKLANAHLEDANLSGARLQGATGLTITQLAAAHIA
jgi:uncharacterized protein YjbI with pentapeptide repeats